MWLQLLQQYASLAVQFLEAAPVTLSVLLLDYTYTIQLLNFQISLLFIL